MENMGEGGRKESVRRRKGLTYKKDVVWGLG